MELLQRGASPSLCNARGRPPLATAAFRGDTALAALLLAAGADVDQADCEGRTPLIFAAMFDQAETAAFLLSRGAAHGASDDHGRTATQAAVEQGAWRALRVLRQ